MKTLPIINRLCESLPRHVPYFADDLSITSLSQSGGVATAQTGMAHNLSAGQFCTVSGAKGIISITSLTQVGGMATAILSQAHDLTMGYDTTVEFSGATETGYNGVHTLLGIPGPTSIQFSVAPATASPATGAPKYLQARTGYNGVYQVVSAPTTTSITFAVDPSTAPSAGGTPKLSVRYRIAGALSPDEAINDYTQRGSTSDAMWAFVVIGPARANKERSTTIDSMAYHAGGGDLQQYLYQTVQIVVIVPRNAEVGGVSARDKLEDVRVAMIRALVGLTMGTGLTVADSARLVYVGDVLLDANNNRIVWAFEFESSYSIIQDDTAIVDTTTVPYRQASFDFANAGGMGVTNTEIPG